MPFIKGKSGNVNGKPPGALNHTTKDLRQTISKIVGENVDNMPEWIERIAADDPARAMDLILKLCKFAIPELRSTDISFGENEVSITVKPPKFES